MYQDDQKKLSPHSKPENPHSKQPTNAPPAPSKESVDPLEQKQRDMAK